MSLLPSLCGCIFCLLLVENSPPSNEVRPLGWNIKPDRFPYGWNTPLRDLSLHAAAGVWRAARWCNLWRRRSGSWLKQRGVSLVQDSWLESEEHTVFTHGHVHYSEAKGQRLRADVSGCDCPTAKQIEKLQLITLVLGRSYWLLHVSIWRVRSVQRDGREPHHDCLWGFVVCLWVSCQYQSFLVLLHCTYWSFITLMACFGIAFVFNLVFIDMTYDDIKSGQYVTIYHINIVSYIS